MLGRHHFLLSTGTITVALIPLLNDFPEAAILILLGTSIGSLIPDVDSKDATIFHKNIKGIRNKNIRNISNIFAIIFPFFGYFTKYMIYKPSLHFYDKVALRKYDIKGRHRGYMHSILGLGTATLLTGLYLAGILHLLNLTNTSYLIFFLIGYFIGGILHLLQDSCTKTGVKWNYPFHQWKLKGKLKTTAQSKHTKYQNYFTILIAITILITFIITSINPINSLLYLSILFTMTLYWVLFAKIIARVKKHPH